MNIYEEVEVGNKYWIESEKSFGKLETKIRTQYTYFFCFSLDDGREIWISKESMWRKYNEPIFGKRSFLGFKSR